MYVAWHLLHLERVWDKDGPLQASLKAALTDLPVGAVSGPLLKARRPRPGSPAEHAAVIALLESTIEANIHAVDRLRGDPDFEPDADLEPAGDLEPSLGWPEPGAQGFSKGEDLED